MTSRKPSVRVVLDRHPNVFDGADGRQLAVLRWAELPVGVGIDTSSDDAWLVVDAPVDYSFEGQLRGTVPGLAGAVESLGTPVLSLAIPSRVDAVTGETEGERVSADRGITLALPKSGLPRADMLYLADIGVSRVVSGAASVD